MKNKSSKLLMLGIFLIIHSCQEASKQGFTEEKVWRLGWRMIENSWMEEYELAESQFDSLLAQKQPIEDKFLVNGLEVKHKLSKTDDIQKILSNQSADFLIKICRRDFAIDLDACAESPKEEVQNPKLQLEIIKMYLNDQSARGSIMKKVAAKYQIDTNTISTESAWIIDEMNRNRLKEIFQEHGFPTRNLIGKEAMEGIFFIIQHSDGDKNWQKAQFPNIESAVKKGDLNGQKYAYLYDRIQVNSGEKQRYGTQFSNVDPIKKTTELAPLEDLEKLDEIRRKIGLMPIEMYKRLMLKNL